MTSRKKAEAEAPQESAAVEETENNESTEQRRSMMGDNTMHFRGFWNDSTEYSAGDCVVHQGQLYVFDPNYYQNDTGTPPDQGRYQGMWVTLSQGAY